MNSQWQSFLESQSAQISAEGEVRFAGGDPFPACALFDLSHLRLIRVAGEDARDFLQGQFTNDIREVTENWSQLSAYCSPKGRMLANFRIFLHQGDYFLQMPRDTYDTVLKRLPMFVLMSKVKVSDASDDIVSLGLAGNCAEGLLQRRFEQVPAKPGEVAPQGEVTLIRLPGEPPRYQVSGAPEAVASLWSDLSTETAPANTDYWSLLDIRAGIPTIYRETSDAFVPQMANMQQIDGVSFTKGCYTGQEVVARMKYLGKLKRRMYLASVATDIRPMPGDELFAPGSESGQGAGKVVNASPAPGGGFELLAVTEIKNYEADNLHLQSAGGPKLQLDLPPYGFEES